MSSKELPFDDEEIQALTEQFSTPFHLYDEAGIRTTARQMNEVFDWVEPHDGVGYINHFAVKATPTSIIGNSRSMVSEPVKWSLFSHKLPTTLCTARSPSSLPTTVISWYASYMAGRIKSAILASSPT